MTTAETTDALLDRMQDLHHRFENSELGSEEERKAAAELAVAFGHLDARLRNRRHLPQNWSPRPGDWTVDPETGRSNSSPLFRSLVDEVGRLIRSQAHHLISGRADMAAGLIVAQLAHVHHLAPAAAPPESLITTHQCYHVDDRDNIPKG